MLEIRRPNGDLLYSRARIPAQPTQCVPQEKIAELNAMMSAVVKEGTGRRALLGFTPQAGKTGTNQSYRDAWFIGFTGHYVTGVWFGNDDFTEMKSMTGGTLPAATWKKYMVEALAGKPPADLPGVPVDDTHTRYIAENQGADGLTGGERTAPAASEVASRATDFGESGDDNVNVYTPPKANDGVVSVLQDMFSIFGKKKQPASKVGAKKKKKKASANFNFFQKKD